MVRTVDHVPFERLGARGMRLTRARYRTYGGVTNYVRAARDLLAGAHRRDDDVPAFEDEFSHWIGSPHVVMTSLARVAIHDLVRAYLPHGGRVLMSPYTIVDVVNMVLAAGATPVFVDVDPATGNLSPAALEVAVTALPAGDAMVLVTHLHGVTADMEGILAVTRRAGLPVVEDAAQSLGATLHGRRAGTLADAGVYSLGSYKNVNAHFGGVVVTRDARIAETVRAARDARPMFPARHLLRKLRETLVSDLLGAHPMWGFGMFPLFRQAFLRDWEQLNRVLRIELDTAMRPSVPTYMLARPTSLQARSAWTQLPFIDDHAKVRIAATARYLDALDGHPGLLLPPRPDGLRHVYTYCAVQVTGGTEGVRARRHDLLRQLARGWRDVAAQHLHDVSALPAFRQLGGRCPEATRIAGAVVLLPTYPGYDAEQIEANIAVLHAWR